MNDAKWIAGCNICGYMPDVEPAEFCTQESARRYIIECLLHRAECQETEGQAEELTGFAEDVNLQRGEFSAMCLGWAYWVTFAP